MRNNCLWLSRVLAAGILRVGLSTLLISTLCVCVLVTGCGKDGNSGGSSPSPPPPPPVNHFPRITGLYWRYVDGFTGEAGDSGWTPIDPNNPPLFFELYLPDGLQFGIDWFDEDGDSVTITSRIIPTPQPPDKGELYYTLPPPYIWIYCSPDTIPLDGTIVSVEIAVEEDYGFGFDTLQIDFWLYNR